MITCVGTEYVNTQIFNDNKINLIEELLHDADGDKKKNAAMVAYTYDNQVDLDEVFLALCDPEESDIIIATKNTFENFENKDLLITSTEYVKESGTGKYDVLTDSSGRVYAVSLENNDYIKELGFYDTTEMYIAVLAEKEGTDELSGNKKNARNIAQVIIKEGNV